MTIYELAGPDSPITQGDILDGCPIFVPDPADTNESPREPERYQLRVIVLTQACDLANQKTERVVVATCYDADFVVQKAMLKATVIRDQVRRGQLFGWYYLPADESVGLTESIVDLRDLHSVPRGVLDRLVATGKRVARLVTPFREHLAQHFAVTYMRIALPEPYESKP